MKKTLQQIANILLINIQHVDSLGLLHGKMGIALFLFHYARYCGNNRYNDVAEDLIDEVYDSIRKNSPVDFADGLTGIGWGLIHLMENQFVEGNPDEVLEGVDKYIFECMDKELESSNPHSLFGQGIYFLSRTKNKQKLNDKDLNILNSLFTALQKLLSDLGKKNSLSPLNSILYFLIRLEQSGTHQEHSQLQIDSILDKVAIAVKNNQYDPADITTFSRLIALITPEQQEKGMKMIGSGKDYLPDNGNIGINIFIKEGWQNLLYFNIPQLLGFPTVDVSDFMDKKMQKLTRDDLTLNKGLPGLGLGLMRYSLICM